MFENFDKDLFKLRILLGNRRKFSEIFRKYNNVLTKSDFTNKFLFVK